MANESRNVVPAKNQNAPARGKQAGDKAKAKEKAVHEQKPMGALGMLIICVLVFLIMLVVGFAALYLNLGNARTLAVQILVAGNSPYAAERAELTALQLQLKDQGDAQVVKESELLGRQATLEKEQARIDKANADLEARRAEIDELFAQFQARTVDFEQLVAIYGSMDSKKAAQALSLVENIDDIARLMSALKKDKAAQILGNMDAQLAAGVTERMLP